MCIRWVDQHFDIHEDFIGLVQVYATDADSIGKAIREVLTRGILPLSQRRGQVMTGIEHDGSLKRSCNSAEKSHSCALFDPLLKPLLTGCSKD